MAAISRPVTTLFLIQSLDGKISTGMSDELDIDRDFPRIDGLKQGLQQYYDLEQQTDLTSFNSGKALAKIGTNQLELAKIKKTKVSFVVVDNEPHLTANGVAAMAAKANVFYIVTTNDRHPAYALAGAHSNIVILNDGPVIEFVKIFQRLRDEYRIERMTIQSGGELNARLLREDLIDFVQIVIAPALVGGRNTPSLVDGDSLERADELFKIRPLRLLENRTLADSYVALKFEVMRPTIVSGL